MNDMEQEKIIQRAYRGYLKRELARPEVSAHKEKLLREHFHAEPLFFLSPALFVPAVCLLLVFGIFFIIQHPAQMDKAPLAAKAVETVPSEIVPNADGLLIEEPVLPGPGVLVKRITSQVGPTMVYQKIYQQIPITIIWVFSEENKK